MRRGPQRRIPNHLGGHRSLPNLIRTMENGHQHLRIGEHESGDFRGTHFNRADLLPNDAYALGTRPSLIQVAQDVFWAVFKGCFITLILINITSLAVDPTPLYRAVKYVYAQRQGEDCDTSCKIDLQSMELKSFQSKLKGLENEIAAIIDSVSNMSLWRHKLEYEFKKAQNISKRETMRYIAHLENKIVNTLKVYDADKVGMMDYAMESAGGDIEATPDTIPYPYPPKPAYIIMGVVKIFTPSTPRTIIQPGTLPGQCFSFHGDFGRIIIKLAQTIQITSVTLEHSHRILESDRTCCPKDFNILGVKSIDPLQGWIEYHDLGRYTYKLNESALQNFKLEAKFSVFESVELRILNNYGNKNFTCVYRFRVHGEPVK